MRICTLCELQCKQWRQSTNRMPNEKSIRTHTQITWKGKLVSLLLVTLSIRQHTIHFVFLLFLFDFVSSDGAAITLFSNSDDSSFDNSPSDATIAFPLTRTSSSFKYGILSLINFELVLWIVHVKFLFVFSTQIDRIYNHWIYLVFIWVFIFVIFLVVDVLFATCFNLGVPLFTLASRIYW